MYPVVRAHSILKLALTVVSPVPCTILPNPSTSKDGEVLPPAQTMVLLRELLVVACTPGTMGGMAVGPSPLDPIFWMVRVIDEQVVFTSTKSLQ